MNQKFYCGSCDSGEDLGNGSWYCYQNHKEINSPKSINDLPCHGYLNSAGRWCICQEKLETLITVDGERIEPNFCPICGRKLND